MRVSYPGNFLTASHPMYTRHHEDVTEVHHRGELAALPFGLWVQQYREELALQPCEGASEFHSHIIRKSFFELVRSGRKGPCEHQTTW